MSLSYDSGSGNGPFGFGWSLSLPSITRKTDKGLPKYQDSEESDVFVLSGAEDLVPDLVFDEEPRDGYMVRRYRPRIEGLFARIERWTKNDGDVHWRSISKDNILTIYGKDNNSRIFAPDEQDNPDNPTRIFSWLICETRDDKGNAVVYEYKKEDSIGIDLAQAHERNRSDLKDKHRTANRYLKHIKYGNRVPLLDEEGRRPQRLSKAEIDNAGWMFEVVFDYDDHDPDSPKPRDDEPTDDTTEPRYLWKPRQDPFSSYRAGFEVRTYRLCQRVLMFHHFPGEDSVGADCLVRSTDFTYSYEKNKDDARNPIYSFLLSVKQTGYKHEAGDGYVSKSLPPVEFEYTQPIVNDTVEEVDSTSLKNLPIGIDGSSYQWTDLHGEGIPGILTEQAGVWFYKRNISPIPVKQNNGQEQVKAQFAPIEAVALKPNLTLGGGAQFMDLAGDGQPDLVVMDGPMPGLYEHDNEESWQPFRPFIARLNRNTHDPNLKFVDLDGDGHADVLITEDNAFVWHASLAEEGFGPAYRVAQALDEEKGPRLVFADGTESIYLADMSGDGLSDLVRIRNGEVCYWPNLGYCRFGAKVTMDWPINTNLPTCFDNPDQFDNKRIRLADIDGSGTTDIIYLHRDGVRLYFNQSGNSWSAPYMLKVFPRVDDVTSIVPTDLLGNGTACLVWSSPLPGDVHQPMRYVNLMGGYKPDLEAQQQEKTVQKPHLLVSVKNNLGAETLVYYAPSTKFYLQDKRDGKPWITRLPFPVHVVERVETYDRVSRNRFVTRYAFHHGYFDGEEREFHGFGMVEQWDTEEIGSVPADQESSTATNLGAASFVPPVHTKTWFHTGIYLGHSHVSDFFAGLLNAADQGEYFREPGLTDEEERALLLPDTVLLQGLTLDEEREACRALKGAMLRQEVYALDGSSKEQYPYSVAEQNFTIRLLQPRAGNRYTVFFTHAREAINFHYERNPADPRIQHALKLEVDNCGNVLKEVAIAYGRRQPDASLPTDEDRIKQTRSLITYTENIFAKDPITGIIDDADNYRTPLPCETRTYELTGFKPENNAASFSFDEWTRNDFALPASATDIAYEQTADNVSKEKRIIELVRTLYRKDDLSGLLPLGELAPLALPGESYKLAFTPSLLAQVFKRNGQPLLTSSTAVLGESGADQGGYVDLDGNGHWWIPSGRIFYSPRTVDLPAEELAHARRHFFLPHRYRDPFGQTTLVYYDSNDTTQQKNHNLLAVKTEDAIGNVVTTVNNYRVLQPIKITDPNGNHSEVQFDALGMVVGTAVMGKVQEPDGKPKGDSLDGFKADITLSEIQAFVSNPRDSAPNLLKGATSRIIYDADRFLRCGQPPFAAILAREIHKNDTDGDESPIQINVVYSDGFGREIQTKIRAESGDAPQRDPDELLLPSNDIKPGKLVLENGELKDGPTDHRWVGKGRTVYNNKGKPVKQYEPFFSSTHLFEEEPEMTDTGVTPVLFYDPVERVVATLHPNHTYEKVIFDPWQQETWDVNDTIQFPDPNHENVMLTDPSKDPNVGDFFRRLSASEYSPTWYESRKDLPDGSKEKDAAIKAVKHASTPSVAHLDSLGRVFLTIADNGTYGKYSTRVEIDIEGNQRTVIDALDRIVMRYDYDMLGNKIHQSSMEAGERWMLNDVTGKPIRAWDSRDHKFRTAYDQLRRPVESYMSEGVGQELLVGRTIYGEMQPNPEAKNLRGKVYQVSDQAGVVTSDEYDFKGNLLSSRRKLAKDYINTLNWSPTAPPVALEDENFTSSTTYDALNRPIELIAPHSDKPGTKVNVIHPRYNEANLLESIEANLNDSTTATSFVTNIDYNAKGQRTKIVYGSGATADRQGVTTTYTYDPLTFRLVHLLTMRNAEVYPDDCPQPPPDDWPGCQVQSLFYTYDPAGNIMYIRDDAQQRIYFREKRVEPSTEYTYDAIYRLIEAKGREHLGQIGGAPEPYSESDQSRVGIEWSANDGRAMGTYFESYIYDSVGNIKEMKHRGCDPAHPGWTRSYDYIEKSQIKPTTRKSNRLSSTMVNPNNPQVKRYLHDEHGNMIRMPHLANHADPEAPNMHWDYKDQLHQVDLAGSGTAYYVYDTTGQRTRKVVEKSPGLTEERIYLGGFEVYREYNGNGALKLERETLHIMDDKQRIALVETRTFDTSNNDPALPQLIRYQFGNHLGSASLELDEQAKIISYEEYYPYGSTSYQAVKNQTETPKRYRYTGKERDEESGLYYHGARYYSAWLGRWTACDPSGLSDGANLYSYVAGNSILLNDPTGHQGQRPAPGLTISPQSQISARQFIDMINRSQKLPAWMKTVFSAQGNRILVKSQLRLPPSVRQQDIPQWFLSSLQAIQSGDWHLTTGASNVSKKSLPPNEKLQGDYEPGDVPIAGPKKTGIMLGETIESHQGASRIGLRKMVDENAGGGTDPLLRRPATDTRSAEGLIIVANRFRNPVDLTKEIRRSDDAILETFFHELAAHADRASKGLSSEHGSEDWLNAPITETDELARAVHLFFSNPSEEPIVKAVRPTVWERATMGRHKESAEKKENFWDRIKKSIEPTREKNVSESEVR